MKSSANLTHSVVESCGRSGVFTTASLVTGVVTESLASWSEGELVVAVVVGCENACVMNRSKDGSSMDVRFPSVPDMLTRSKPHQSEISTSRATFVYPMATPRYALFVLLMRRSVSRSAVRIAGGRTWNAVVAVGILHVLYLKIHKRKANFSGFFHKMLQQRENKQH